MLDVRKQVALRHTVASQFVGHDHSRHILQTLQQSPEESLGGWGIAAFLNEDVEHNAVLIHGAPQIARHALDPDEHLVQVPLVAGSWPSAAQAVSKALAEFPAPAPNRLIGDNDATFSQEQLNISQAEAEHVVQPDSMADDLGGKAMAVVRVRWRFHAPTVFRLRSRCHTPVTVTMPAAGREVSLSGVAGVLFRIGWIE